MNVYIYYQWIVCVCAWRCTHVCMCARMHVCMCLCVCMQACVCVFVCMHVYVLCIQAQTNPSIICFFPDSSLNFKLKQCLKCNRVKYCKSVQSCYLNFINHTNKLYVLLENILQHYYSHHTTNYILYMY